MKKILLTFLALMLVAAAFGLVALATIDHLYHKKGPLEQERLVLIPKGAGLNMIAQKLENEGVISNKLLLRYGGYKKDVARAIKAGEYLIPEKASAYDVLSMMVEGRIYLRQVTIPEGLTSAEIIRRINAIEDLSGPAITTIPQEGSLLPNTYSYQYKDPRSDIVMQMQNAMKLALHAAWQQRNPDIPLKTKQEAIIMASIIEKETGIGKERAKVSGVFANRLSIGMPLQSDPTVIYAITMGKEALGRPLYRSDLKKDSPYNTYRYGGLPPAPISNPGIEAIQAALNPAKHRYLYFVADGTGGHAFATTLQQHNRNVQQWRAHQKKQRELSQESDN
jgi:UPF0755 protein